MERTRFITYKGKEILVFDLSNVKSKDLKVVLDALERATSVVVQQPEKSILALTNVSGSSFDSDVVEALKQFAKHNKPYVRRGAVVGVDGIKKVIYNAVMKFSGRNIPVFDTIEEAKEYLVKE